MGRSDLYYDGGDYYDRLERIEQAELDDYEDAMLDAMEARRDLEQELADEAPERYDYDYDPAFGYDEEAGW